MGPTASGKSKLALRLAKEQNGEIINADSVQCFADLRVLSSRPSIKECDSIPHHLYGFLKYDETLNAVSWANLANNCIRKIQNFGKRPILVGGSGFYIQAITEGLSSIPDIDPSVRESIVRVKAEHPLRFHKWIQSIDPLIEKKLHLNDTQRVFRALEVKIATDKSIFEWQAEKKLPFLKEYEIKLIERDRATLYERIEQRFLEMINCGAIQEVAKLAQITKESPLYKTIGVLDILNFLEEKCTLKEMIEKGQQRTRNYAKRQMTWVRMFLKKQNINL
jgi:tRNA dimethylallyltransferase